MPPVECEILTITLWAMHGKSETKSRWYSRLGGAVPPLVVSGISTDTGVGRGEEATVQLQALSSVQCAALIDTVRQNELA